MNKFYLLVLSALLSASAIAQHGAQNPRARTFDYSFSKDQMSPLISPRGEINVQSLFRDGEYLDEDFEDTPLGELPENWSTEEVEQLDSDGLGTDEFVNAFRVMDSEAANEGEYWPVPYLNGDEANKFAGAGDDGPPCNCDMAFVFLQTPEIDLSGATNVALSFDIFHDMEFGGGDAHVEVSTDEGDTWVQVSEPLNVDQDVWQSVVLPLYEYSGESSLIIRFTWSDEGTWASGFAVDNVSVGELADFNQAVDKVVFGDWNQEPFAPGPYTYTMIPQTQVSPMSITAIISNNGFMENTGVGISVDIFENGLEVLSDEISATINQTTLTKDTLSISEFYTPPSTASTTIEADVTVFSDNEDDDDSDNSASTSLEISEYIYARDNGSAQAFVDPGNSYVFGNLFDIHANQEATAVRVAIGSGTEPETAVFGVVYLFEWIEGETDPTFTQLFETDEYIITGDELNAVGGSTFINLPFDEPIELEEGQTYLVGYQTLGTPVRTPVSGTNEWVASWLQTAGDGWSATASVPMIRLSFDPAHGVGIKEIAQEADFSIDQNVPNPFSEMTRVDYTLNMSAKVSYEVHDVTGKLIDKKSFGQQAAGSHSFTVDGSDLEAGIYHYTVIVDGQALTKKMIVK